MVCLSMLFTALYSLPSHRSLPEGFLIALDDEEELTKWLPDRQLLSVNMVTKAISRQTEWGQTDDLEKGLGTRYQLVRPAIARPKAAFRKQDALFSDGPSTSSASTLATEIFEDAEEYQLPGKRYSRLVRNSRYTFFSIYHRLNLIVVLANVTVIVALGIRGMLFNLDAQMLGTAAAANILAAVLIRQELVINLLFATFGSLPYWAPLRIRRMAAKVHHLGGVHSGAGITACIWFGVLNVPVVRAWEEGTLHNQGVEIAFLSMTAVLDLMLLIIVIFSHPWFRTRYHNTWECIHRFAGWTAVSLFWGHTILSTEAQRHFSSLPIGMTQALISNPVFWCLFVVTVSLILPWLRLRRVPVRISHLSDHVVRLHFGYTNLPLCTAPKFSDNPLREWHAFAGIPEDDGVGFSILVSDAGDWTKRVVQNPPKELWTRGIPARGVLHLAPIFKRVVLVATGSGIGPILSLLHARSFNPKIIWSTPDPFHTYSVAIVQRVKLADPDAVIINTTKRGRPDLVLEAYSIYRQTAAEAVFVISNPKVTRKVVYGLESRGVPIFAPIFDS